MRLYSYNCTPISCTFLSRRTIYSESNKKGGVFHKDLESREWCRKSKSNIKSTLVSTNARKHLTYLSIMNKLVTPVLLLTCFLKSYSVVSGSLSLTQAEKLPKISANYHTHVIVSIGTLISYIMWPELGERNDSVSAISIEELHENHTRVPCRRSLSEAWRWQWCALVSRPWFLSAVVLTAWCLGECDSVGT